MSNLTLSVETLSHAGRTVKVLKLSGMADATNVAAIDEAVLAQMEGEGLDMVVEGSALTYINSTFIGHLTDWYTRMEEKQGRLVLVQLAPQPLDALQVVGILSVIPHYLSLDEAKLELGKPVA